MLGNYRTTEELVKQLLDEIKERKSLNEQACDITNKQNKELKL